MKGGVEGGISLGSLEWGTMEVGSANMEEMATLGRFQCELVHQNGGGIVSMQLMFSVYFRLFCLQLMFSVYFRLFCLLVNIAELCDEWV